ncbi:MAG: hypothetical protein R3D62_13100 [Xanthobacteraceae bacterium]
MKLKILTIAASLVLVLSATAFNAQAAPRGTKIPRENLSGLRIKEHVRATEKRSTNQDRLGGFDRGGKVRR